LRNIVIVEVSIEPRDLGELQIGSIGPAVSQSMNPVGIPSTAMMFHGPRSPCPTPSRLSPRRRPHQSIHDRVVKRQRIGHLATMRFP
jgi:hypothetical protein